MLQFGYGSGSLNLKWDLWQKFPDANLLGRRLSDACKRHARYLTYSNDFDGALEFYRKAATIREGFQDCITMKKRGG